MRGSLGLVIGVAIGAGAMYLVLRRPWAGGVHVASDAGVVAVATHDAGKPHGKRRVYRHHGRRRPSGAGGPLAGGDDPGWGDDDGPAQEATPKLVQLSAADRAMEWRGDSTAKPVQKIDMAGGEARSLSDAEIQDVIAGQSGAVQRCVVAAATNTDLAGTITVRMIVAGNGHVARSKVEAPHYMFEHGLLACVQRAAAGLHFPATGQATLVTLPVNLTVTD